MGLFSKIKGMITRSKTPKLNAGENYQQNTSILNSFEKDYTIGLSNDGEILSISSLQIDNRIKHRTGEVTNIVIAEAVPYYEGKTIKNRLKDKIVFEIPEGAQINDIILQKIGQYYEYERNMPGNNKHCMYLGKISQEPYDIGNNNKSEFVKNYIKEKIEPTVERENQQILENIKRDNLKRQERNNREMNEFHLRMREEHIQYMQEQYFTKKHRIDNAYLEQYGEEYLTDNGIRYCDYNGINIVNGDFLRVRRLNKVGKDENGTYLYTGYVQTVPNEDEDEILGHNFTPYGMPVCFATDKKIEDIIQSNNKNDLKILLSLLSQAENINDNGYLNYIGKIDKYNTTDKNIENTTSTIQSTVARLQQEFYKEKNQEQQAKREDNYYRG